MCDEHNSNIACIELLQDSHNLYTGMAIQISRWLIGQDQRWPCNQRAGNSHALLLSAGEFCGPVIRPRKQSDQRQRLQRLVPPLIRW
jgi:hypothetical protein